MYGLIRPLLFRLDAERAHRLAIRALRLAPARPAAADDPTLAVTVAGLRFPNPVGLAAGFDKDAEVAHAMPGLGFGFAEVGTLTPLPQPGNPQPRLFRLAEDRAVINRMGFNNGGQAAALARLAGPRRGIVGVNVGANKDADDRVADYVAGVRTMARYADYLAINISSPNTPGLRDLQGRAALDELLHAVAEARKPGGPPIFLKVAPDLSETDVRDIAEVAETRGMEALIVSNTTVSRPPLRSVQADEAGGLSGAPLRDLALGRLRDFRAATSLPLIAAGGIASAEDVVARLEAGASLVQLYSALVYEGPGLPRRILHALPGVLAARGHTSVAALNASLTPSSSRS